MSASVITGRPVTSGLYSTAAWQPVPLDRVGVEAHVVEGCARVTVHQSYRNVEHVPIEVVYTFPLDEGASVVGFEARVDGVRYVGRAMEREEAFRQYDEALEAGHGGYLLDEERADVFTASLGNVRPGAAIVLSITYVTPLAPEGNGVRFTLPTTVSPRYAPAEDQAGVGPTPADTLNPPVALDAPYGFSFEMDVTMGGAIRSVQSPSHPIEVEQDGATARVRLSQRRAPMDRDLVIVIAADALATPHATVERGARGGAVVVTWVPRFDAVAQAVEMIFVLDCSGSMAGASIEEVRNAMQLCLRSLSPGCRFNIFVFGTSWDALFPASRAYDEASMGEAAEFVRRLEASMGGTEILPVLRHVLQQEPVAGLPRQVLVLTDGEVTNTDAVLALVRRHAATTRFFTFGIGAAASQHLVRGIARASGGAAEFISPGERIEAKVMRQFKRVLAPALTDVKVDWGQPGLVTASDRVPPVFDGERLTIYALGEVAGACMATLRGTLNGRPVAFDVPLDAARAVEGETIAALAARERIRTLEEQGEYLESRGSLQRRARATSKAAAEIVALAVKYQLASRETSFVAIEHRETPVEEQAELRRVPVVLAHGWGGSRDRLYALAVRSVMPAGSMGAMSPLSAMGVCCEFPPMAPPSSRPDVPCTISRPAARAVPPSREALRPHDRLIALQRADGSWDLDAGFATAVSLKLRNLEKALREATGDPADARRALATAVALAWLETHAPSTRVEWEMLAEKAGRWLSASRTEPAAGQGWQAWLDVARRLL